MAGGGPDGGATIRYNGLPGTSKIFMFYEDSRGRHSGLPGNSIHRLYAVTQTNNILHVWLTCRRLTGSSPRLYVGVNWASASPTQVINPSYTATSAMTSAIDLSGKTIGEWYTLGPYQIGPFQSQWQHDGYPHRITLGVRIDEPYGNGAVVEVANIRAIRVEA